jgi:hypothetical protein
LVETTQPHYACVIVWIPSKKVMNQQRFVQGAFLLFALGVMAVQAIAG